MIDDNFLELTSAQRAAAYADLFPIYGAYRDIIHERNSRPVDMPITEPCDVPGSVDTVRGAQLALERIGHPGAKDELTVKMAAAYIARLGDEVDHLADDDEPTMLTVLVDHFWTFSGCIPSVESWNGQSADEKLSDVVEIIPRLTPELLQEVVLLAMPKILADVIEEDRLRIRRAGLTLQNGDNH